MSFYGVLGGCQGLVQLFGSAIRVNNVTFRPGRVLITQRLQLSEVGDGLWILFQLLGYVAGMRQERSTVLLFRRRIAAPGLFCQLQELLEALLSLFVFTQFLVQQGNVEADFEAPNQYRAR